MPTDIPRILYLMGTGRSGSTLLEVLLASAPATVSAGELTHVLRDGFLEHRQCACGEPAADCPVWSAVYSRLGWSLAEVERLARLQRRLESHSRFPLLLLGLLPRRSIERYAAANARLYAEIAAVSGAPLVIDSSKYAGRALALARAFPDDIRIIWLSRSPRALIAAFQKPHEHEQLPKHPVLAAAYCLWVGWCARQVRRRFTDRVFPLRYEELQQDPQRVLSDIERWCGLDLTQVRDRLASGGTFAPGHIVTGNRLRHQREIRFRRNGHSDEPTGRTARLAARVAERLAALLRLEGGRF